LSLCICIGSSMAHFQVWYAWVVSCRWAFVIPFAQSTNGVTWRWWWCARSGNMINHFQNDADKMVQNKPRIESYTKPYLRSVPSAMGVESKVEAMDIGHMYYAHSTSGEHYYLQMLLTCVKGATSYEHLRIVDGTEHDTFKDACIGMGLLTDDNQWHQALEEADLWASGRQLHDMFASMMMFCEVTNPIQLWDAHWESLSDDIEAMTCQERDDLAVTFSEDALKDRAMYEID